MIRLAKLKTERKKNSEIKSKGNLRHPHGTWHVRVQITKRSSMFNTKKRL